jgi:hypothetical protein
VSCRRQHPQILQLAAGACGTNNKGQQQEAMAGPHQLAVSCRQLSEGCDRPHLTGPPCLAISKALKHSTNCCPVRCCVTPCCAMLCCQDTRVPQLWALPLPQGHVPQVCAGEQRLLPCQDPGSAGWHMRAQAHTRLPGEPMLIVWFVIA